MNRIFSHQNTRILLSICALAVFALAGCKKKAPTEAPAEKTAEPAKEAPKAAEPAKEAAEKPATAPAAEEAKKAEAAAPVAEKEPATPAGEMPADKKNAILTLAADVACMEKVKKPEEVAVFKEGRVKRRNWSVEDFDNWSKSLLASDETYKKRFDALLKNCPPENVSPADQAKAEAIYVDLVCLTKKGLPREEVQKSVPNIYKKHEMTGPEYSRTMRSLLRDRSFGQALAKKIQEACPGPAKKPAGIPAEKAKPAAKPAPAPAKK